MKYTDRFFKIPIIMYDDISLTNAMLKEENEEEQFKEILNPQSAEFTVGVMAIPYSEFKQNKVSWTDTYKKGDSMEDIKEHGFQETLVSTVNYGDVLCAWDRKKFEEKLNEFMEWMEKQEKSA